jgi:hypothetical protein
MYSREAFKLCVHNLPEVLVNPQDVEARGNMQLGAAFAGLAIENSMLGAAHAAANPLTAHYGIVHGQAVGLMLPHVVRFNGEDADARQVYAELASAPEIACVSDGHDQAWDALISRLEMLLDLARMPRSLDQCGVERGMLPTLAQEAARQWTAGFNPRPVTQGDLQRFTKPPSFSQSKTGPNHGHLFSIMRRVYSGDMALSGLGLPIAVLVIKLVAIVDEVGPRRHRHQASQRFVISSVGRIGKSPCRR